MKFDVVLLNFVEPLLRVLQMVSAGFLMLESPVSFASYSSFECEPSVSHSISVHPFNPDRLFNAS